MSLAVHAGGGIAVATFTLPALGFAIGSAIFERPPVRWEAVGNPDDFPNDTYIPRVVTTVVGIGEVGKTTVYIRAFNPDIDGEKDPKIPFADERGGDFVALSTRCMHLGCPVRFVAASKRFICPCHGGVYDFTGKVSGGPPVRPLDRFYVRVRNEQLEVGPRYSVNSEFERFPSYRDPGQDLDGVGQYLYPGRFSTPKMD
jgi:menaquinol-cytochrome c reductase iron-sulfur subunit